MEAAPPALRALAARALRLPDEALLAECKEQFFNAGGPGGQHRNKAETAVRLLHLPTGAESTATERRSQAQNRSAALWRLREKLQELTFVPKPRRPTRPTKGSQRRRLDEKRRQGDRKRDRQGDW